MASATLEDLRAIVLRSFPELAHARFTLLTTGWDSVAVDVDEALIFKFPRHAAAEKALRAEASLLSLVRPEVTMAVPHLTLCPGPPLFSRHVKLKGEHLVAAHYERLPVEARERLAADLALFYAELHHLNAADVEVAGGGPIRPWLKPDDILRRIEPILPAELHPIAEETIAAWQRLPPDPHGTTYGFFDGHGWNMAFDHTSNRLNGVYDFGDSGFGPLRQDVIYSSFISPDLTARIIDAYEHLTGLALDPRSIHLLSGVLRLWELAECAREPDQMRRNVAHWATFQTL